MSDLDGQIPVQSQLLQWNSYIGLGPVEPLKILSSSQKFLLRINWATYINFVFKAKQLYNCNYLHMEPCRLKHNQAEMKH